MEGQLEVKLVISEDDGEEAVVRIGFNALATLIQSMPDTDEMAHAWEILSHHESADVRAAIAYKEKLNETTLLKLVDDPSKDVRHNLLRSDAFQAWVDTAKLLDIATEDVEFARNIAASIGRFTKAESSKLIKALKVHHDPLVRFELAANWDVKKSDLKSLSMDKDPSVAEAAKKALEDR